MDRLRQLENDSVYIIREAYARASKLGVLWSIGKDSTVLLWLVRKAFCGHVPCPVVHIDTTYKIPEMIAYRDTVVKELGLTLVVGQNEEALAAGMGPEKGRVTCCGALKTQALKDTIVGEGFDNILLGIRRDEDGTRAKERVFSPRNSDGEWNFKDQVPEIWQQYNASAPPGGHVRVHPILAWSELEIWEYIRQEEIPVLPLYFAKDGKRYRTLGCQPCTSPIESTASTLDEIIEELKTGNLSERRGRAQDQESFFAMQALREKGYM